MEVSNLERQYYFLNSLIETSLSVHVPLTESIVKILNFHAIAGLHEQAGQYRDIPVKVGSYRPPEASLVPRLMEGFIANLSDAWETENPTSLAAYSLWQVNKIHPFVNGNGRTARAVSYFILCNRLGVHLPGTTILPEMLRREPNRAEHIEALREADNGNGLRLIQLIQDLLTKQISNYR